MKRSKLNFIIDAIAFIAFLLLTTTGILLHYILPPGSGKQSTIWNLDRHEWGDIHFWISIVFFSILALHLFYHWRWILSLVKGKPKKKGRYRVTLGVLGLFVIIILSTAPLITSIEIGNKDTSHETVNDNDSKIKGSMTFNEIEIATKVPATYLIEALKLPESISKNEKLSYLKKIHGFEMSKVIKIIEEYHD